MAGVIEGSKRCPDCGEVLKPDSTLCRYCGYAVPVRHNPVEVAVEMAAKPEPVATAKAPKPFPTFFWAMISAVIALSSVATWVLLQQSAANRRSDWEVVLDQSRAKTADDIEFERAFEGVSSVPELKPLKTEVRAFAGMCLVNLTSDQPVTGWQAKFAAKQSARAVATEYSVFRTVRGRGADATAVVFINGQRLGTSRVRDGKLE